jgi:hypothetical protein
MFEFPWSNRWMKIPQIPSCRLCLPLYSHDIFILVSETTHSSHGTWPWHVLNWPRHAPDRRRSGRQPSAWEPNRWFWNIPQKAKKNGWYLGVRPWRRKPPYIKYTINTHIYILRQLLVFLILMAHVCLIDMDCLASWMIHWWSGRDVLVLGRWSKAASSWGPGFKIWNESFGSNPLRYHCYDFDMVLSLSREFGKQSSELPSYQSSELRMTFITSAIHTKQYNQYNAYITIHNITYITIRT